MSENTAKITRFNAALMIFILSFTACPGTDRSPSPATTGMSGDDITLEAAQNAAYRGLQHSTGVITLKDGRWEGQPYTTGGAARPSVALIDTFLLSTDLDQDGKKEAVVFLSENSGGSGSNIYLSVLKITGGKIKNTATQWLGDRVQIKQVGVQDGEIMLEIIQSGPGDAACCPGEVISRRWRYHEEQLIPAGVDEEPRRLSLAGIEDIIWILCNWDFDEPAILETEITLTYHNRSFAGTAGCNSYFTAVSEEDSPGTIKTGLTGATRMMCPDRVMSAENRYIKTLEACHKYGYMITKLMLSYTLDGEPGVLLFRRKK